MSSVVTLYGMKELSEDRVPTLNVDWLDPKLNIGIEIEVENEGETSTDPDSLNMWTVKSDGSLRRGQEFVLSRPLRGEALSGAIEEFFQHNRVFKSPTSGTHIHVDMRDREATLDVAKTMAAIIACIEPAIFGMFAEGREWCGYTNPITTLPESASFSLFSDKADDNTFRTVFSPTTREYKYYGFNMLPLGRYGSVEFRYFNTAEDAEELIEWVQFCMAVKIAAVKINLRSNLKNYLSSELAWEEFLTKFFGRWRDRMLPLLPYSEVAMRWKQTRNRPRKLTTPKVKMKNTPQASSNKLVDTRFKKFFAIKMRDTETGKLKLVYDMAGIAALTPNRVFIRPDPFINDYQNRARNGDYLISDDLLYMWSEARDRWMEVSFYAFNPDRITDTYMTMTEPQFTGFVRALRARLGGVTDPEMIEMNSPSVGQWRQRMVKVLAIFEAYYANRFTPAPQPAELDESLVEALASPNNPDFADAVERIRAYAATNPYNR